VAVAARRVVTAAEQGFWKTLPLIAALLAPWLWPKKSRGGFTTKIHIRAEGLGKPVTFSLTSGQVHEHAAVRHLDGNQLDPPSRAWPAPAEARPGGRRQCLRRRAPGNKMTPKG
jgi:hypothetical protein